MQISDSTVKCNLFKFKSKTNSWIRMYIYFWTHIEKRMRKIHRNLWTVFTSGERNLEWGEGWRECSLFSCVLRYSLNCLQYHWILFITPIFYLPVCYSFIYSFIYHPFMTYHLFIYSSIYLSTLFSDAFQSKLQYYSYVLKYN